MNDVAYVSQIDRIKAAAATCPACRKIRPPLLCRNHVQDLTQARRQREGTLLRSRR